MRILKKNTLLVGVNAYDVDEAYTGDALIGVVAMPSKNKSELIIPVKNNLVYFTNGIKLCHKVNGDSGYDWFLVNKSDVLATDTEKFQSRTTPIRY